MLVNTQNGTLHIWNRAICVTHAYNLLGWAVSSPSNLNLFAQLWQTFELELETEPAKFQTSIRHRTFPQLLSDLQHFGSALFIDPLSDIQHLIRYSMRLHNRQRVEHAS